MDTIRIETVKDLKNLIKDLPDECPVGTYYKHYWIPELKRGKEMCITENGLAVDINYCTDY